MPSLVQNSKLLLICTRHGCNPCTKFGIDHVKGSKDIERTTHWARKSGLTLTFDLNIKIIYSQWIWIWQDVFALWHRHTKFLHMGVSPWDYVVYILDLGMTLTFDLYGWRWVSLVSFTHSFYLVFFFFFFFFFL